MSSFVGQLDPAKFWVTGWTVTGFKIGYINFFAYYNNVLPTRAALDVISQYIGVASDLIAAVSFIIATIITINKYFREKDAKAKTDAKED